MSDPREPAVDLLAYYRLGREPERLSAGSGRLEWARTTELLLRWLPPSSSVADIGGADGRYAAWLAAAGHRVELVDPVPLHVELACRRAGEPPLFGVQEGDARNLPLADGSMDVVLLLGPLYHLGARADRIGALREAARVCRSGGVVVAAAISRFAPLLDAIRRGNLDDAALLQNVEDEASEGRRVEPARRTSPFPDAYFHLPDELEAELTEAGLEVETVVGVQGPGWLRQEDDAVWASDERLERLGRLARRLEGDAYASVLSAHLLALSRVP